MNYTLTLSFKDEDIEEVRDSVESFKIAKIEESCVSNKLEMSFSGNEDGGPTSISFEPSYDI